MFRFSTFVADTPVEVTYSLGHKKAITIHSVMVIGEGRPLNKSFDLYEALSRVIKREDENG